MRVPRRFISCFTLGVLCFFGTESWGVSAEKIPDTAVPVKLTTGGKALLPLVVSPKAGDRVRKNAQTLADMLERISGAKLTVESGDGTSGIAVGLVGDFATLELPATWDVKDATHREDYLLRTHSKGVQIVGVSDLAVEYAIWDFLYRLGYRQFFPGKTWEVVPHSPDLTIAVSVQEHPDFVSRDIGFGFGPWNVRAQAYTDWCVRNRLAVPREIDRPVLSVSHAFGQIMRDQQAQFDSHPEYLASVGGKRVDTGESKFCIGNPQLRALVAKYAEEYFTKQPGASSISLEPSDGLGWCECEKCRALGSVSDQLVVLLNEAAAAIRAKHGDKKLIGIYAYAEHAPPPQIRVDPQVVVNIATSMTIGDFTTDQLIEGWRKQGAQLGIREYYGVYPWDRDLPGQLHMADLEYLKRTIPHFYDRGARFMTAESSDSWGVGGLGYYLTARILWDVRDANRIEELTNDFLDKAFGPARKPMSEFFRLVDASNQPRLSRDLIGRMYRLLDEAWKLSDSPFVADRISDLVLYTRYVELYRDYAFLEGPERQRRFEDLLRYTYRIRAAGMLHTLAVWRGLPYYDPSVKLPAGVGYDQPEGKDPWKSATPYTLQEKQVFVAAGIANHPINDFTPVEYSVDLVPIASLALPDVPTGDAGLYYRDRAVFYTWAAKPTADFSISVKGGLLFQTLGTAKLSLFAMGNADAIDRTSVAPDQLVHAIKLSTNTPGLHKVEVADRTAGTILSWPANSHWTIPAGPKEATNLYSRWTMYFYVPKGTRHVAGWSESIGEMQNASGQKVFTFGERPDYFNVPVKEGEDGKLWRFVSSLGKRVLLTVPPYLARNSQELLLPAEVVKADTPK